MFSLGWVFGNYMPSRHHTWKYATNIQHLPHSPWYGDNRSLEDKSMVCKLWEMFKFIKKKKYYFLNKGIQAVGFKKSMTWTKRNSKKNAYLT